MKIIFLRSVFLGFLSFAFSFSLPAQSNSPDAHLSGTLFDATGNGVAGVRVTAQLDGAAAAPTWTATSTTDGAYTLAFPPGRYRVRFARPTFVARDFVLEFA